jgi:hypothetical protein
MPYGMPFRLPIAKGLPNNPKCLRINPPVMMVLFAAPMRPLQW